MVAVDLFSSQYRKFQCQYATIDDLLNSYASKRSLLVDGKGVPLGVIVDGVNKHNMKMTKATLQSKVIDRPGPTVKSQQSKVIDRPGHMRMDKGYDYELLEDYGYTIHIPLTE